MLQVFKKPLEIQDVEDTGQELDGYIKFVVDLEKEIITAGGLRHVDGEQLLLSLGSMQSHLWGGGVDTQTKIIDFDSMINIRPHQDNPSREVLNAQIRKDIERIVRAYFQIVL